LSKQKAVQQALLTSAFEFTVEANEDQMFWRSTQKREEIGATYEAIYYSNVNSLAGKSLT